MTTRRNSKVSPTSRNSKGSPSKTAKAANTAKVANRQNLSIDKIKESFAELDKTVKGFIKSSADSFPSIRNYTSKTLEKISNVISNSWQKIFDKPLSKGAANSLTNHYINLYGKPKKGGNLVGSPLDYSMRPGLPGVANYATFPTEVGMDPKAVSNMDVYYNSGMSHSCRTEGSFTPPNNIGSNLVTKIGGRRRRNRKTQKRKVGGDFMTALDMRQFVASNPSGPLMRMSESWAGVPASIHDNSDPSSNELHLSGGNTSLVYPPLPSSAPSVSQITSYPKIPGYSPVP
jgi:hypothetical protein